MDSSFTGAIMSDYRFEGLVYEIEYDETSLAYVTQEEAIFLPRLAFFPPFKGLMWNLPLEKAIIFFEHAKEQVFTFPKVNTSLNIHKKKETRLNYSLSDVNNHCRAEIDCSGESVGEVIKEDNSYRLLIYASFSNPTDFEIIVKDIPFDEFIILLKEILVKMKRS